MNITVFRFCKVKQKDIDFFFVYYMIYQLRKRTKSEDMVFYLHLYFSGFLLKNTAKVISKFVKGSHSAIRDWILK
jgi:hypothetical protein